MQDHLNKLEELKESTNPEIRALAHILSGVVASPAPPADEAETPNETPVAGVMPPAGGES